MCEEYSKAAALLTSPGLAPLTEATAEKLQALLQPRPDAPALDRAPRRQGGGAAASSIEAAAATAKVPVAFDRDLCLYQNKYLHTLHH